MRRIRQLTLLKNEKSAYGGDLRKTRAGRSKPRPLSTRETMHLVLRSTQAKGAWSFKNSKNEANVARIVSKFSSVYGVSVLSMANVGNHLHLHLKLGNRFTYNAFIRAITGAIALAITKRTRWNSSMSRAGQERDRENSHESNKLKRFWDHRPFTRIVQSFRGYLKLQDYVRINQLESDGYKRETARMMIEVEKLFEEPLRLARRHAIKH
jgi:REP element-mobilizing transposase RayT